MKTRVFISAALVALGAVLLGFMMRSADAEYRIERRKVISERMAISDLADAVSELEEAASEGDIARMNRAAGRAEVALSRSGLNGCENIYGLLSAICEGECDAVLCRRLSTAVKKAYDGDGGKELRRLSEESEEREIHQQETTEDPMYEGMLKSIGRGKDRVAERRAVAFACPNAAYHLCESDSDMIKYSGDNIFIAVEKKNTRVVMYCFDREVDGRYSVKREEADAEVRKIIKREKLNVSEESEAVLEGGIYRYDFPEGIVMEIYSDTARLRKYDATEYYRK